MNSFCVLFANCFVCRIQFPILIDIHRESITQESGILSYEAWLILCDGFESLGNVKGRLEWLL